MSNLNLKIGDRVKTPCGCFGTVRATRNGSMFGWKSHYDYVVDFDQDTPDEVSQGNCFLADGSQAFPEGRKASRIDPINTAVPQVGDLMKCVSAGLPCSGVVIASVMAGVIVETTFGSVYKIDPVTLKDTDGDLWEITKPPVTTTTYLNVYADGSLGATPHSNLADATKYSQFGKVRVGILRQNKEADAIVDARMIDTYPQLRTSTNPEGINPFNV